MVVTNTNARAVIDGDGANQTFTYPFLITDEEQIVVTQTSALDVMTTLTLTTDYTVTGVGTQGGGTIILGTIVPTANETITLHRVIPIKQETDLENQGGFFADTHEDAYDLLTLMMQDRADELDRAVKVPINDDTTDPDDLIDDLVTASAASAASAVASAASAVDAAAYAASAEQHKHDMFPHISLDANSATTISVGSGFAYDDTTYVLMTLAGGTAIDTATTGANGLDTGALAADTNYYIYIIATAGGTAATLASLSATAPTMPSGYTLKRLVSFFKTATGSAAIVGFNHHALEYSFFENFELFNSATGPAMAPSYTDINIYDAPVDFAAAIPAGFASRAYFQMFWKPNAGTTTSLTLYQKATSSAGIVIGYAAAGGGPQIDLFSAVPDVDGSVFLGTNVATKDYCIVKVNGFTVKY